MENRSFVSGGFINASRENHLPNRTGLYLNGTSVSDSEVGVSPALVCRLIIYQREDASLMWGDFTHVSQPLDHSSD